MKIYIKILRWFWEFPQCFLGFLLTKFYNVKLTVPYRGINIYAGKGFHGGISLGLYILMSDTSQAFNTARIKDHEWGHTRQSLMLGPLYLIVIGLPSIIWAMLWNRNFEYSYYWFYTERWADNLSGIPER